MHHVVSVKGPHLALGVLARGEDFGYIASTVVLLPPILLTADTAVFLG